MRFGSLVSSPLVRKAVGSALSFMVNDLYAMHCKSAGGKKGVHNMVDHALIMNVLARYGMGCDLEFAEYSIIQAIEAIKTISERH